MPPDFRLSAGHKSLQDAEVEFWLHPSIRGSRSRGYREYCFRKRSSRDSLLARISIGLRCLPTFLTRSMRTLARRTIPSLRVSILASNVTQRTHRGAMDLRVFLVAESFFRDGDQRCFLTLMRDSTTKMPSDSRSFF